MNRAHRQKHQHLYKQPSQTIGHSNLCAPWRFSRLKFCPLLDRFGGNIGATKAEAMLAAWHHPPKATSSQARTQAAARDIALQTTMRPQ